ncbi:flavin reductase family protein [Kaistella sp.]|uniref:flavin reductase family protein n=1 Tax=Kaistella sp. TaxID=2782235 RepID=UPI002F91BFF2
MNIHLNILDIQQIEHRKRTALINSLSGFKSLNLIGTVSRERKTNLALFNSVIHLGADPALMGFISRPHSVERHTIENIVETKFFTINHITADIFEKAHQTSARYPRVQSEFEAVGLTAVYKNNFAAPFVEESKIQIGLELKESVAVKSNDTLLIIGEIKDLYFPENIWLEEGVLDIEKAETLTGSALDGYHTTKLIKRMKYAKP